MWDFFLYAGIWLNVFGVLGLFFFGMPFHVPERGAEPVVIEQTQDATDEKEAYISFFSWISLFLILLSAVCQTVAIYHGGGS